MDTWIFIQMILSKNNQIKVGGSASGTTLKFAA